MWTTCGSQYQRVVDASVERCDWSPRIARREAGAREVVTEEILGHLIDSAANNQIGSFSLSRTTT